MCHYDSTDIYKPSNTIYFANAPRDFTEQDLISLFTNLNAAAPVAIKFFNTPPGHSGMVDERRVGLIEFADVSAATEALLLANNHKIGTHILKLSFTQNSIHNQSGGPAGNAGALVPVPKSPPPNDESPPYEERSPSPPPAPRS